MKKILICLFVFAAYFSSQAQSSGSIPKNEVKWNIANTIVLGSVEVGYEYFIDGNQSLGAEVLINDSYNFGLGRSAKDFNTNSFQVTYNYYTGSQNVASGLVISPMLKLRVGDYQRSDLDPKISMNSFILGIGVGYKWNYSNKFVFGPYANIGRDFSQAVNDEFKIPLELNAGFGIGYRF